MDRYRIYSSTSSPELNGNGNLLATRGLNQLPPTMMHQFKSNFSCKVWGVGTFSRLFLCNYIHLFATTALQYCWYGLDPIMNRIFRSQWCHCYAIWKREEPWREDGTTESTQSMTTHSMAKRSLQVSIHKHAHTHILQNIIDFLLLLLKTVFCLLCKCLGCLSCHVNFPHIIAYWHLSGVLKKNRSIFKPPAFID